MAQVQGCGKRPSSNHCCTVWTFHCTLPGGDPLALTALPPKATKDQDGFFSAVAVHQNMKFSMSLTRNLVLALWKEKISNV